MKKNAFVLTLLISLLTYVTTSALSIVYNFRIAQITKQPVQEPHEIKNPYALTSLLFYQNEKKYTGGIHTNFAGLLEAFVYNFSPSIYIRTDTALSYINEKINNIPQFSDTETDDILFTAGYNFTPNNRSRITFSGLCGIPTHPVYALQHVAFGYGQIGVGLQLDGLYELNDKIDFLCGTRYIYFVPRSAQDETLNYYTFTIGNVADLLFALKTKGTLGHGLEGGYAARWDFGAHVFPNFDNIVAKTNYTRNSFYLVYKYKFKTKRVAHRFLFDIGYGFDSKSKTFGNQRIITSWASWTINF